ncbi:MAG: nucleotidyltransferase family protein, partial [Bacilli bacterium]|nr:nucleotidyltransferase family protein [Bacilli bacterium]
MQNEMILKLLDAHLNKKTLKKQILTLEQWDHLLTKAFEQSILPLVYENVLSLIDNNQDKQYIKQKYNFPVIKEVSLQVQKTETFLKLYKHLYNNGVKPIIVKGLICRNIYPNPDFRVSGDEDIIVSSDQYEKCHKLMLSFPMMSDANDQDIDIKEEIKYLDERRMLLIEMHKVLFPGESIINTDWNTLFISTYTDTIEMNINNTPVISLSHSNHMLYLVLHLFKHFLHSGVGIRQVCDIMMYAKTYGKDIDWEFVLKQCAKVNADYF